MLWIRDYVSNLKKRYETSDPIELSRKLDITVICIDLPKSIKGFYVKLLDSKIIYINYSLDENQKTYTCAYELGHALLYGEISTLFINNNINLKSKPYNSDAEYFAACLLLDDSLVNLELTKFNTMQEIALFSNIQRKLGEIGLNAV